MRMVRVIIVFATIICTLTNTQIRQDTCLRGNSKVRQVSYQLSTKCPPIISILELVEEPSLSTIVDAIRLEQIEEPGLCASIHKCPQVSAMDYRARAGRGTRVVRKCPQVFATSNQARVGRGIGFSANVQKCPKVSAKFPYARHSLLYLYLK